MIAALKAWIAPYWYVHHFTTGSAVLTLATLATCAYILFPEIGDWFRRARERRQWKKLR